MGSQENGKEQEKGQKSCLLWSAATCRRFFKSRLVAILSVAINLWDRQVDPYESGDKSPHSKYFAYQLDFVIPGINPFNAISLKLKRESLKYLINPLARPVSRQRLRRRTGDESLGILLREMRAA